MLAFLTKALSLVPPPKNEGLYHHSVAAGSKPEGHHKTFSFINTGGTSPPGHQAIQLQYDVREFRKGNEL